jgi:hypothetical protein
MIGENFLFPWEIRENVEMTHENGSLAYSERECNDVEDAHVNDIMKILLG